MAKTALELTPQEWQAYQPAEEIERRRNQEEPHLKQRQRQAWRLARQAARLLQREFGAERVVVFGSLVHEFWFTAWSDIDLATWGISSDRFYAAVAAVTGLSSSFKIDLVDPETCRPIIRAAIEEDGVEL